MRANGNIRQIIRHKVRPEHIAFVNGGPKLARPWAEIEPVGIAHASAENALCLSAQIILPNKRAAFLDLHPMLANVGNRADRNIEPVAIGVDFHIAHPMPAAGGQIHQLAPLARYLVCAQGIVKAEHFIMIGNVKRILMPRHARGGIEIIAQHLLDLSRAVAIAVTQQHYLVGRSARRARPGQQQIGNPGSDPAAICFRGAG